MPKRAGSRPPSTIKTPKTAPKAPKSPKAPAKAPAKPKPHGPGWNPKKPLE